MRRKILSILMIFALSFLTLSGHARIFPLLKHHVFQWQLKKGNPGNPGITPLQVDYIELGKQALQNQNIIGARDYFREAVNYSPANEEANFWYGLTRILAVYEEGSETSSPNLNSIKGLALAFGITFTNFGLFNTEASVPEEVPPNAPTVNDVKNFIKTKLLPEVDGAISNMEKVTSSFSSYLQVNGTTINVDYADALIIRSAIYALKASLEILLAYNLQIYNIPDVFNGDIQDVLRFRKIFSQNSDFLKPEEPSRLSVAKNALINFVEAYNTGADLLRRRSDGPGHLFVIDLSEPEEGGTGFYVTSDDTQSFQNVLLDLKDSLSGSHQWDNSISNETIDLSKFFNANSPLNLQAIFFDKDGDPYFHDPTLGGILPDRKSIVNVEIPLVNGWNLVAIPLDSQIRGVGEVLRPIEGNYKIVWGWDPVRGWLRYVPARNDNTLTELQPGKGYWIYVERNPNYYGPLALELYGSEIPRSINLTKGWNLIAYPGAYTHHIVEEAIKNNPKIQYLWTYTMDKKWLFHSPVLKAQQFDPFIYFGKAQAFWVKVSDDTTFEPPKMDPQTRVGYEVWAGSHFTRVDDERFWYCDPQRWGWKFVARVDVSDPSYNQKTFSLPQGTRYVLVRASNPLGEAIKIDGIALDGLCGTFVLEKIEDFGEYKIHSFVDNVQSLFYTQSCSDGQYAEIYGGAGIIVYKDWNASQISTITVYASK